MSKLNIKGITTTSAYEDGDCLSLVNLRKKNGALKPIAPRQVVNNLTYSYDALFVHQLPNTGENYIAVRLNKLWFLKDFDSAGQVDKQLCSLTNFKSITQIGNVLNVLDSQGLKHIIWYDNDYVLIDSNFNGAQTDTVLGPVKVDFKVTRDGTDTARYVSMYFSDKLYHGAYNNDQTSSQAILQLNEAKGLFAKALSIEKDNGGLHGFIQVCTAIELYDGSYILHSSPVLMGQSLDKYTRYEDTFNYKTNKAAFVDTTLIDESATVTGGIGTPLETPDRFILDTINERYTGSSQTQYRGTANNTTSDSVLDPVEYEAPNLYAQLVQVESTGSSKIYATISCNKLQYKVNLNIAENLKTLVKSVSVFMTPEVSIYKADTCLYIGALYTAYYGSLRYRAWNWQPEVKTNKEIIEELKTLQFYKVHEIPFDELQSITPDTWIDIDLKGKLGDNLVNQEVLPLDDYTHHQLIPNQQMTYNSRLHAMDYKTVLSRGWPVNYFYSNQGIGQFEATETQGEIDAQRWLESIEVKIKTENGMSGVVRITPELQGEYLKLYNFSPMISYPDSRATELTLYRSYYHSSQGRYFEQKKVYKLTASDNQNFAYYIDPDLKPINLTTGIFTDEPLGISSETQRELIYRNGLKVSSLSNPFYYPAELTYSIGTSTILFADTNAIRTSDGETGKFPLYVGTKDGVYAMIVGDSGVVYSNISLISNEVPTRTTHCSTPYGVVYIGRRGLFLISGQKVDFISGAIEQHPLGLLLELPASSKVATVTKIKRYSYFFLTYLASATNISYHALQNEIIVSDPTSAYNWVLNLDSKEWYQQTEKFSTLVGNIYPKFKGINGIAVKDFDLSSYGSKASVSMILRPFTFGTTEVKALHRYILRARLQEAKDIIIMNHSSNDGLNFDPVQGKTFPTGDYKDIDMGLMSVKNRQFMFTFAADLSETSEIAGIDVDVSKEYNNDKMR